MARPTIAEYRKRVETARDLDRLYNHHYGKPNLYIVWHDVWSNRGLIRTPIGVVETKDENKTRLSLICRLFGKNKLKPKLGGRNILSLTLATAESDTVTSNALRMKKFLA